MSDNNVGRRAFLKGAGIAALGAAGVIPAASLAQYAAPNSTGTARAKLKAPPNSCDCHQHIYDPRFPSHQAGEEPNGKVSDYRLVQRRIGITRSIVITPGPYATDNRVTLDAIQQLAPNSLGLAVINPSITDAELKTLADGGIRGIRCSVNMNPNSKSGISVDMLEPLSKRVNELGWHIDVNMDGDHIKAAEDVWPRLVCPIVFDHMGHLPQPMGINNPGFAVIRRLVDQNRAWVKLSLGFGASEVGPPTYSDIVSIAQAYVKASPERLVWGPNWPHPGSDDKPDDAQVFDLLAEYAPNAATRHRILVENPEVLYRFLKSS
jgi:predicted TIM-barrel fold metal-dependent hydrolase